MAEAHLLLLAGTAEAHALARRLAQALPGVRLTVSFAGAVSRLPDLGVPTRVGGFGGADGLADHLREHGVSLVIDATHPFAARMSRNAAAACAATGVALLRLERPPWHAVAGDAWTEVDDLDAAAAALPSGARAFLAVGRRDLACFAARADLWCLVRMIEPPDPGTLPAPWTVLLARPSDDVAQEEALMRRHAITHVVAKNSGGARAYAKLAAARRLGLPVVLVRRPTLPPALPPVPCVDTLDVAVAEARRLLGDGANGGLRRT
ncbi:cobalt-precorrin-6A reductase [Polymorphum gilvum]|uniref:Precorrin-6x reductase n=1 Tax=Polymorphum gilvum (strain LMG 25793 / CGMCC 1.9160 / SL003B-26A1) TaxID=991905 RepID=F2J5F8_POLGS|nr:cobalt-precorrin-6A reductase [Polymorphum gilvum]ADZ72328.1 Precorrin-6x reductase [Polymorphum gilvum SL003B-26A1]